MTPFFDMNQAKFSKRLKGLFNCPNKDCTSSNNFNSKRSLLHHLSHLSYWVCADVANSLAEEVLNNELEKITVDKSHFITTRTTQHNSYETHQSRCDNNPVYKQFLKSPPPITNCTVVSDPIKPSDDRTHGEK